MVDEMEDQPQPPVTFKIRASKRIEFVLISLIFLAMFVTSLHTVLAQVNSSWSLWTALCAVLCTFVPGSLFIAYYRAIFRSKLIFSTDGVYFDGLFSAKRVPWKAVVGVESLLWETYLLVSSGNSRRDAERMIPLTWFTPMPKGIKQGDSEVVDELFNFAPHLFEIKAAG